MVVDVDVDAPEVVEESADELVKPGWVAAGLVTAAAVVADDELLPPPHAASASAATMNVVVDLVYFTGLSVVLMRSSSGGLLRPCVAGQVAEEASLSAADQRLPRSGGQNVQLVSTGERALAAVCQLEPGGSPGEQDRAPAGIGEADRLQPVTA